MTESIATSHVTYADSFERARVAADARHAAHTRDEFTQWLGDSFVLDRYRAGDMALATYEALANAAEFAYLSTGLTATMDVRATHDPHESTLTVTVSDHGLWRTVTPTPNDRSRGRGIALMKALSDRASIHTSTDGTTVRLVWANVSKR